VGRVTGEVPSMHITTTRARAAAAAVALLAGLAVPVGATAASASPQLAATPAAHSASAAGRVPHFDHIVVLMLTEHGFTSILRSKYAPTLNRLASEYGLATHYYTTSDPDTAGVMAFLAGNSYGSRPQVVEGVCPGHSLRRIPGGLLSDRVPGIRLAV
jgi:hypothetical protein